MKKPINFYLNTLACAFTLLVLSCYKSNPAIDINDTTPNIDMVDSTFTDSSGVKFPVNGDYNCSNSPDYGNTILYSKWRGPRKAFTLLPSNNKNVEGTYYAWPAGLAINSSTGEINLSQSETGMRYVVGFVKKGTQDTCLTKIVLGGATFVDSIYVLSKNDTLARPFFNADPTPLAICDDSDDDDYPGNSGHGRGNNKCEWDDDDDPDGNGPGDEPPPGQQANAKNIRVRTISGNINLKRTLKDGAFGSNPQNGARAEATIYYRLNDVSKKVLQKIKVELVFYNRKTDIPTTVVNEIEAKNNDFFQSKIMSPNGKPRPPQILITRFAN